jgi:signal transduction histidine kinase
MSFLVMDAARLRDTLPDNADARGQARSLQEALIALGREVQGISHRLHASKIELLGLPAAADNFCKELESRHDINVEFAHDGVPRRLPEGVAISLFRVLQEALSNVVKHANAQKCRVRLNGVENEVRLEVRDDGRGFDAASALSGYGLGLISMQERLKLVKGSVVIESEVGRGTTIRATVPLRANSILGAQEPLSADPAERSVTI